MAILGKVFHFLSKICYLMIFVYAIVCLPVLFGYKPLVVLTGSMLPTYKIGSVIYYKQVPQNELNKGDVITFKLSDGSYVSHRINRVIGDLYETKGDANTSADPEKIGYSRIIGKDMPVSIPYAGYYITFINENIFLVVFIIVILVSEFWLNNNWTLNIEKKERREEYGRYEIQ